MTFLRDSVYSVAGSIFGKALMMFSTLIVTNEFGPSLFGEFSFLKTTAISWAFVAVYGMNLSMTKLFATPTTNREELQLFGWSSLFISTIASLLVGVIIWVFLSNSSITSSASLMGSIILLIPSYAIFNVLQGICSGLGDFRNLSLGIAVGGLLCLLLTLLAAPSKSTVLVLGALSISYLIPSALWIIQKKKALGPFNVTKSSLLTTIKFSASYALQDVISPIYSWAVSLLILGHFGNELLGIYSAHLTLLAMILVIPGILRQVMLRYFVLNNNDVNVAPQSQLFKQSLLINCSAVLPPLVLVIVFKSHVSFIFGQGFQGIAALIIPGAISVVLSAISNVYFQLFFSLNLHWHLFIIRLSRDFLTFLAMFFVLYIKPSATIVHIVWLTAVANSIQLIAMMIKLSRKK